MKTSVALPCFFSYLLVTAACRNDDGPSPYVSGVQEPGPVSDLDRADLEQLCRSFEAHVNLNLGYDALAHTLCLPQAPLLSADRASCQRRFDDCTRDLPPPIQLQIDLYDDRTCVNDLRACDATVAELEGCANLSVDWVYRVLQTVTCADAGNAGGRTLVQNGASACLNTSPGCRRFVEVMGSPELF